MEPLLLRKRWLHQLGERWASEVFVTLNQFATAEEEALVAAATLIPDPVTAELPNLPIEEMNDLIAFEDEDNDDQNVEREYNYPGILKAEPTLEESLFDNQTEQDDNEEARVALAPPASTFEDDSGSETDTAVSLCEKDGDIAYTFSTPDPGGGVTTLSISSQCEYCVSQASLYVTRSKS
jgi:hypothetical protein